MYAIRSLDGDYRVLCVRTKTSSALGFAQELQTFYTGQGLRRTQAA